MGNLDSVARAVEECGGQAVVSGREEDIESAQLIILPGVGSFAAGMKNLRDRGLEKVLNYRVIEKGIPCLGLCLGMHLLASKGYEGGCADGLGWIEAEVTRLEPSEHDTRIPHVGWNDVNYAVDSPLFEGIPSGKDFYFAHSYKLECEDSSSVISHTPYCGNFASAVRRDNVYGVQFHPEKSQRVGFQLLRNFLSLK